MLITLENPDNGRFYYIIREHAALTILRGGRKRRGVSKIKIILNNEVEAEKRVRAILTKRARNGYVATQ